MSEELSDADRIRNKRLAKLGSTASTPQAQSPTNTNITTSPNSSSVPGEASSSTPRPNPFAQLSASSNSAPTSKSTSTLPPSQEQRPTPAKRLAAPSSEAPSRPKPTPPSASKDNIEDWEHRTLSAAFRISLTSDTTKDAHGNRLYYCGDVKDELSSAGAPLKFNTGNLESALMNVASSPGVKPLDYMLGCWKRISRQYRGIRSGNNEDPKYVILKEARRLCMSYCIFAATIPDMFDKPNEGENLLIKHLLVDPESDHGICHDFLSEAVLRFEEDESIKDALKDAMIQMSRSLATKTMNDDYRPYINALRNFVRYAPLVTALAESEAFLPPDTAAQDIEKNTLLGPFFQISPMQGAVAMNYFSSPKTRDPRNIASSQNALRMTLQTHQTELFDVVDRFIKTSKVTRDRILDWFAHAVNTNHKRRAMRTDPKVVASDGFMNNMTVCLDRLCEPFMDATFSKINRIEPEYFRRSPRVQIRDETKINADQPTSDAFYDQKADGVSNFISEVFFLTVAAHHYGPEATHSKLSSMQRDIRHMESQLEELEGQRPRYAGNAVMLARYEQAVTRYKQATEEAQCVLHSIQGVLLDELMQARSMSVMRYVIIWLLRLVSGLDFPKQASFQIPLPSDQPDVFKCLPEYFLEDVVDNFKWVTQSIPQVITSTQCDELVMICLTFLRSSEYVKNPYLKSGLVTILFYGIMPFGTRRTGVLTDVLNSLPFANQHLLHALMQFYIECEVTGASSQFYDKFNIRYEIFQVIKAIWPNSVYRENLKTESRVNTDFFVRFVNLILNDATYVLDESFSAFHTIHDVSEELKGAAAMDEQIRKSKEEALEAAKQRAKSYMSLTNESLATLMLFTEALAEAFTSPEVVQRLADMLDYNLDALTGPKSKNLKVERPEEYRFNPPVLVNQVISVYLNLASKYSFQQAIARDGRSYRPQLFDATLGVLDKVGGKTPEEVTRFRKLGADVKQIHDEEEAAEEDLGEIPDEFLDPLLSTLMIDPVILPVSRTVIDRATIRQHLLSDAHDPFNRAPLKIEDVIPATEIKEQIEAFIKERKEAKIAALAADKMDTA